MKIEHIVWLEEIIEKLDRKHDVQQDEVRELLDNKPHFRFVEKGHRPEEKCLCCIGADGRRTLPDSLFRAQKGQKRTDSISKGDDAGGKEKV